MNLRGSTVGASRTLLLLCVGLGAVSFLPRGALLGAQAGESLPLEVEPRVADNLALLYAQFSPEEFAACLEGKREGETYRITDFRLPPQERVKVLVGRMAQTGLRVKDGICGDLYASVVTLHSHPPSDRDDHCYASRQDTVTTVLRTRDDWLAIICVRGILFWHRSQLTAGEPAYPIPGQVIPFPARWAP